MKIMAKKCPNCNSKNTIKSSDILTNIPSDRYGMIGKDAYYCNYCANVFK